MLARVIVVLLASAVGLYGQTISSGSNGSDGALNLTTAGTVLFNPAAMGLDADKDNVLHFTTVTIGPGVTVKMKSSLLQGRSVVWLATGAVQIDGTIDLNGDPGLPALPLPHGSAEPGPGGYPGGIGGMGDGVSPTVDLRPGLGPGGAGASAIGGGHVVGLCAGHAIPVHGLAYGNAVLVPLRGGSGGGGGGSPSFAGGGGGAGGGAIRIFSSASIALAGTITANGGNGGTSTGSVDDGCGGSGGGIHLIAPLISGSGSLLAKGGTGSFFGQPSWGRIRVDAFQHNFSGTSDPAPSTGTPYNVPLPAGDPTVRVTSIGGITVSETPTGSFVTPDVSINQGSPLTVNVQARNIPVGTIVQLRIFSSSVPDFVVNTTPLAGTVELSTATASVAFPPGFSLGYVRATWSPPAP